MFQACHFVKINYDKKSFQNHMYGIFLSNFQAYVSAKRRQKWVVKIQNAPWWKVTVILYKFRLLGLVVITTHQLTGQYGYFIGILW